MSPAGSRGSSYDSEYLRQASSWGDRPAGLRGPLPPSAACAVEAPNGAAAGLAGGSGGRIKAARRRSSSSIQGCSSLLACPMAVYRRRKRLLSVR
mmetsp:Transcript_43914/g.110295  ORF Transcript_43914/g.110295 Transcript_43914/m.110295 type:complete len:95 (-) Transcript_43914:13-297(-)